MTAPERTRSPATLTLVFGFGLVVVIFAAASVVAAHSLSTMRRSFREVKSEEARVRQVLQLASAVRDQYAHQAHMILLGDDSHMALYRAAAKRVRQLVAELRASSTSPVVDRRLAEIEEASTELDHRFQEEILPAVLSGDIPAARRGHDAALGLVLKIAREADALVDHFEQSIAWWEHEALELQSRNFTYALVLLIAATLFAVVVGTWVGRSVSARHQEELLAKERLASAGRIAAGVAHEINNPLTVILGYLRVLQKKGEQRPELGVIEAETLRCKEIVQGLLDLSRPWKDREEPVDLHSVATEVAERLEETLQDGAPAIEVEGSGRALGSLRAIRQVLWNLLENAAEAARSTVRVRIERSRGRVWVHVENDGDPVPDEVLEKLFEPFFTTKEEGTGLGLAVSRAIVQAHDGGLHVERIRGGTRFSFDLAEAGA
ncbi:MAG: GHKL domain-containing protein [Deltaproteobacteria bacterium]|nr:MAG: GHKL domain-containing protein [Deltaproteobacteria bacterium]